MRRRLMARGDSPLSRGRSMGVSRAQVRRNSRYEVSERTSWALSNCGMRGPSLRGRLYQFWRCFGFHPSPPMVPPQGRGTWIAASAAMTGRVGAGPPIHQILRRESDAEPAGNTSRRCSAGPSHSHSCSKCMILFQRKRMDSYSRHQFSYVSELIVFCQVCRSCQRCTARYDRVPAMRRSSSRTRPGSCL